MSTVLNLTCEGQLTSAALGGKGRDKLELEARDNQRLADKRAGQR